MPRSLLCCERFIFCISVIRKRSTGAFFLCISSNSVNPLFCLREKRQPLPLKPPALRAVVTAPAQQKRRCFLLLLPLTLGSPLRLAYCPEYQLPHNGHTALMRGPVANLSHSLLQNATAVDGGS